MLAHAGFVTTSRPSLTNNTTFLASDKMATPLYHPQHQQSQGNHGLNMSGSQSDPRSLPSPGSILPPIRSIIPDFDSLDKEFSRRTSQASKESVDGGSSHGYTTDRLPTTGSSPSINDFSQHSYGHQESGSRTYTNGPLPRPPLPDAYAQHNSHHQPGYPHHHQEQPVYRQDHYAAYRYHPESHHTLSEYRHGAYHQPGPQQNQYDQRARSERVRYPHPWGSQSDSAVSPRGGDGGKNKRRGNLPKEVTEKLYTWLYGHLSHPYPTEDEKQKMMRETNMQMSKLQSVSNIIKPQFLLTLFLLFRSNLKLVHQRPPPQGPGPHRTGKGRDRGREALPSQLIRRRPPKPTGLCLPHETLQPFWRRPCRAHSAQQ